MKVKEDETKGEYDNKGGEEVNDERLPIDKGWAWVIMIACLMNTTLVAGYGKTLGLLFVEFVDLFKVSATSITLSFGVLEASMSLSCFITMNIILGKTTIRKVIMVGIIVSSFGILLSSFSEGIPFFVFTQTIVGVGRAIIDAPGLVLIGKYFKKRRALATAVAKTGVSLGAVTFPYLVRYLLDTYALKGTLMIMSGIQFQTFVFAMFLIEPESAILKNKKTEPRTVVSENETELQSDENEENCECKKFHDDNGSASSKYDHKDSDGSLQHSLKRDFDSNNSIADHLSKSGISSIFAMAAYPGIVYVPALMIENGAHETSAALFLTITGITDVCSRLFFGYFGDRDIVKRYHLISFTLLVCGLNFMFTKYYRSFELQVMFSVAYGASFAPFACLQPVILTDYLGLENLAKAIGFTYLVSSAAISCYHVIIGAIRDISGSYTLCFTFMGGFTIIACGLLQLLPLAEKLENNKTRQLPKDAGEEEPLKLLIDT